MLPVTDLLNVLLVPLYIETMEKIVDAKMDTMKTKMNFVKNVNILVKTVAT